MGYRIDSLNDRVFALKSMLGNTTPRTDGMPRGSGGVDRIANCIAAIDQLEREKNRLLAEKNQVDEEISRRYGGSRTKEQIIRYYFVYGFPDHEIAVIAGCTDAWVQAVKRDAIKDFEP